MSEAHSPKNFYIGDGSRNFDEVLVEDEEEGEFLTERKAKAARPSQLSYQ